MKTVKRRLGVLLFALVFMLSLSSSAFADTNVLLLHPNGTTDNPYVISSTGTNGYTAIWIQPPTTTHYTIQINSINSFPSTTYYYVHLAPQAWPVGSTHGFHDIPQSVLNSLPKNEVLNISVIAWIDTGGGGWLPNGLDNQKFIVR
ncbi:hypothetical protein WMW72_18045 [Paenibacillus filicis]|uniref:Uncharacterized protein n=1 Tax=Paenibacillus filicis TaxID=669464 RepID=A0ABU9DM15_9BACL